MHSPTNRGKFNELFTLNNLGVKYAFNKLPTLI